MAHALNGSCHCGSVRVSFDSASLETLPVFACTCSFCRRHGARTARDPNGSLHVTATPGAMSPYRFGRGVVDFWLCEQCGVYVFASIEAEGRLLATLNVAGTDLETLAARPAQPMDYSEESDEERLARRKAGWTPLTLVEASPSA